MLLRTVRGRLLGLVAAGVVTLTAFAAPAVASTSRSAAVDHAPTRIAMEAAVRAGAPGVLGRVRDAHGTWSAAVGVADLTTDRPRRPGDRFRIGSITKTFVSTVILQLEAEHRIDLDNTVEHWLPGLVRGNGNDGRLITVRQLLNHTSGLYSYDADPGFRANVFTSAFLTHRYDTYTPEQLVRTALAHAPHFAAGTAYKYSNTDYILVGLIVQKVTGHRYGTEIEQRVIKPLGLRSTTVPGTTAVMPRPHGRGYSKFPDDAPDEPVHDVTDLNPSMAWAAGEMISSAGDLTRFYSALMRGGLLPKAQLTEMLTTASSGPGIHGGGLGISPATLSCGITVWGHDGGIHGSTSLALTTRDGGHTAAFNFNADWTGSVKALAEAEFCGSS